MDTKERVRDLLGRAIDRANEVRPPESRIPKDASTPLTGPEAALDSFFAFVRASLARWLWPRLALNPVAVC